MASIDSYSLAFDTGCIRDLNRDKMIHDIKEYTSTTGGVIQGEVIRREKYTNNNPNLGIKYIEVNESTGRVIIQGSAKILREQYGEGININTFDRVISEYNKTGIIQLNPVEVLNTGELFTVDVTKNLRMDQPLDGYISALYRLRCNERYTIDQYKNGGKAVNGITFKGKQKTIRERQIFYDKEKEIAGEKELRHLAPQFQGVLRAEMNLAQLRKIRYYFGSNKIQDVLSSPVNANLILFDKIVSKGSNALLRLFSDTEGMTISEVERLKGREGIIRDYCGMDWEGVNEWIRGKVHGGTARYRKAYREVFISLQMEQGRILEFTDKHIEEIRQKLVA